MGTEPLHADQLPDPQRAQLMGERLGWLRHVVATNEALERMVKAGNRMAALVELAMEGSTVTTSDDPGCFFCDWPHAIRPKSIAPCEAQAALDAWKKEKDDGN